VSINLCGADSAAASAERLPMPGYSRGLIISFWADMQGLSGQYGTVIKERGAGGENAGWGNDLRSLADAARA
jgi:hypothetical protein